MDEVEQVKNRIDIVEFISSYLTVKKAGANYRALCPFHNEKTPSMMISPEKQIFKCFGCGVSGDVFSFVMQMEGLNFREALEMLAQRSGVKLTRRNPEIAEQEAKEKDTKTRLFRLNALCAQVFHKILLSSSSAKEPLSYLKKRKISEQTMKDFLIGYAPSSRFLLSFLKKKGFTDAEIAAAGNPDRFYQRIIFPITDVMGNVLGFTGRVLDPSGRSPTGGAKYLNTPETIIFHKGRILYNLVRARGDIKLAKTTVVVEGQMDVISSYQAEIKNVVATSGTALTPDHLQILYRYTPNITFAFDSDTAGLATAKKAYEMALGQGFNVKMVDLGDFKDPGEMIEADASLWQKTVKNVQPVVDWYFELAFRLRTTDDRKQTTDMTSQQKKEIAKELLPVIKKIPDSIEQAHYIELLSEKLAVPDDVIFAALDRTKITKVQSKREPSPKFNPKISSEEILMGVIIGNNEVLEESQKNIKAEDFTTVWLAPVYSLVINWYNMSSKKDKLLTFLQSKLKTTDFGKLEMVLMEVERDYSQEAPKVARDMIAKIKNTKREKLKEYYAREIKRAEDQGDKAKLKSLMQEFQDAIR